MDSVQILNNFYSSENEDRRLLSKYGTVEFVVTKSYIEKYLKDGDRILEVGCGTGRYSLHYAHKGFEVDAVELVQTNLDVLNQNKQPSDNIRAVQGNALDLSSYSDNAFDIVTGV